jgi:hypothetical protein
MFEEYLQDAFEFLTIAEELLSKNKERDAKRYYRASVFYTASAMESFINYIAVALNRENVWSGMKYYF